MNNTIKEILIFLLEEKIKEYSKYESYVNEEDAVEVPEVQKARELLK